MFSYTKDRKDSPNSGQQKPGTVTAHIKLSQKMCANKTVGMVSKCIYFSII